MSDFDGIYNSLEHRLLIAPPVNVGEWHAQKVDSPLLVTRELTNVVFDYKIPYRAPVLEKQVKPNIPFAEAQFIDRVSGQPLNPPPSAHLWPYENKGHADHTDSKGRFSHTYSERFWPRIAGKAAENNWQHNMGLWGELGDLNDVVKQLVKNPLTRQAYLPVFFPEDTGNTSNVRVPCTLGYHFLYRGDKLNVTYFIRSVDFVRHFRDDVYMACRLCQWVSYQVKLGGIEPIKPGYLHMHIVSLHCMEGDRPMMRKHFASVTLEDE